MINKFLNYMELETHRRKSGSGNNNMNNTLELKMKKEYENVLRKKDLEILRLKKENAKKDDQVKKINSTIKDLKSNLSDKIKRIQELRKEMQDMVKLLKDAFKKNKRLQWIVDNQDRRLDIHENTHVLSSKQGPLNENDTGRSKQSSAAKGKKKAKKDGDSKKDKPKTKRGGVKGHKGKTQIFKPTKKQRHTAEKCPNCNKEQIQYLGKDEKRTIVSIPEFVPHTVTKHLTAQYKCLCCGDKFMADNGLPGRGQFDYSVIRYVTYQYNHRKTAQMIADDLKNFYGLEITDETVSDIFGRGTEILKPIRDKFMAELEKSPAVLMDETCIEGEPKRWVMTVRNDNTAAYVNAQNRSARDLISQAKNCIGIISRDGYPGYDATFPNNEMQRCSQHSERDCKNTAKRTDLATAKKLYGEFSETFAMLRKWTRGRHSKKVRIEYVDKYQEWLYDLASRYKRCHHKQMKKIATMLENAAPQLFTFLIYPFVHSTTNLAEQSIKPVIAQRRSRLQLKSDKGADRLCIMLTCFETWKLRKFNVWEELRKVIGPHAASNN